MAQVYNFYSYRTPRVLGHITQKAGEVSKGMITNQNHYSAVGLKLNSCALSLRNFDQELHGHRAICKMAQLRNEECQRALERADIDELIEFRDKIIKNGKYPAVGEQGPATRTTHKNNSQEHQ